MENKSTKKENIANYYKAKFMREKINEGYRKKAQKEIIENNYKEKYVSEKIKEKYKELVKEDIGYRLINNLAKRACKTLKSKGIIREFTHSELIGCNKDDLKIYLSSKFTDNMNFDNYGLWELDHIKPIASFNLENIEELKECFNYKNIQPLWKEDNNEKSNKLNWIKSDFK
jgi:hypothetical protein